MKNGHILTCYRCSDRYLYEDRKKHVCDEDSVPAAGVAIKSDGTKVDVKTNIALGK